MENMRNEKKVKDTAGHGMISDGTKAGLRRPLISAKADDPSSNEENLGVRTPKNVGAIY